MPNEFDSYSVEIHLNSDLKKWIVLVKIKLIPKMFNQSHIVLIFSLLWDLYRAPIISLIFRIGFVNSMPKQLFSSKKSDSYLMMKCYGTGYWADFFKSFQKFWYKKNK